MIESKNRPTHHDGVKKLPIEQYSKIELGTSNRCAFGHKACNNLRTAILTQTLKFKILFIICVYIVGYTGNNLYLHCAAICGIKKYYYHLRSITPSP